MKLYTLWETSNQQKITLVYQVTREEFNHLRLMNDLGKFLNPASFCLLDESYIFTTQLEPIHFEKLISWSDIDLNNNHHCQESIATKLVEFILEYFKNVLPKELIFPI